MLRILAPIAAVLLVFMFGALPGGCTPPVEPCNEFAPPASHKPSSCPPKPADAAASRPAQPVRYCYSTLAQVDCFNEPQPGRTGYLGSTAPPPAPLSPKPAGSTKSGTASDTAPAEKPAGDKTSPVAPAQGGPTPLTPAS